MLIKIGEATEIQLDWLVAKCEGHTKQTLWIIGTSRTKTPYLQLNDASLGNDDVYHPSTNWAQGGPIIEREKINLYHNNSEYVYCWCGQKWKKLSPPYTIPKEREWKEQGPTPLIAAMRCYVASTLGDEVDVPEELI